MPVPGVTCATLWSLRTFFISVRLKFPWNVLWKSLGCALCRWALLVWKCISFNSGKCSCIFLFSSFLFALFSLSEIPVCQILDHMGSKTVVSIFCLPFVFFFAELHFTLQIFYEDFYLTYISNFQERLIVLDLFPHYCILFGACLTEDVSNCFWSFLYLCSSHTPPFLVFVSVSSRFGLLWAPGLPGHSYLRARCSDSLAFHCVGGWHHHLSLSSEVFHSSACGGHFLKGILCFQRWSLTFLAWRLP